MSYVLKMTPTRFTHFDSLGVALYSINITALLVHLWFTNVYRWICQMYTSIKATLRPLLDHFQIEDTKKLKTKKVQHNHLVFDLF